MTRIVVKSDASVRGRKIGIGYHIERVGDDGEQVEMLVKDQHPLSPSDCSNHADTVREAEYIGVLRAVEVAREYVRDDEELLIKCDNNSVVSHVRNRKAIPSERQERWDEATHGIEWSIETIPRELNQLADSLSKRASHGVSI